MGELTRKVAHNTFYQVIGKIASVGLGVFAFGLLARHLGADGFGDYTTITTFALFFSTLADMGFYLVGAREIAKPGIDEKKFFSNAFTLRLIFTLFFVLIAPLVALPFGYSHQVWLGILIAGASTFFVSAAQILVAVFQKYLRTDLIAIAEILGRIVFLIGCIILIRLDLPLLYFIVALCFSSATIFAVQFFAARHFIKFTLRFDREAWLYLLKESWPIALSIAFNVVYLRFGTILLSVVRSPEEVGIFGVPYKVMEILFAFPAIFVGLMIPALSRNVMDKKKFADIYARSFDALMFVIIPIVVGMQFTADWIVKIVGGEEFNGSIVVLRVMCIALLFLFVDSLPTVTLTVLQRQKLALWNTVIVAVITVVAALILIPSRGAMGAALVLSIAGVVMIALDLGAVYVVSKIRPRLTVTLKTIVASLVMAAVLWFVNPSSIIAKTGLGIAVFVVMTLILRTIHARDLRDILRFRKENKEVPHEDRI